MMDRDIRQTLVAILSMAVLGSCTASRSSESEIVSADAKHVAIRASTNVDARKIATAHCANYESTAVLVNTPEKPDRVRDFLILPDEKVLIRRPSMVLEALLRGREAVRRRLETEFRPIFLTSTTGRSADPIPFLYTQLENKKGNIKTKSRTI